MNHPNTAVEEPETKCDKLLDLIDKGDPTVILLSENTFHLNELFKHELISINMEKLELTVNGRKAKEVGVRSFLDQQKPLAPNLALTSKKADNAPLYKPTLSILLFMLLGLLTILVWMIN
ncbi:hypothetical protein ACXYMT_12915 [Salinimicrobium sp. CAU 1759]